MSDQGDLLPPSATAMESAFEAEVNKRVAAIVKDREMARTLRQIETHLRALDGRADAANHLKAEMVTKEDFRLFRSEFAHDLDARFEAVVTKQQLGDGDFIIKTGLITLDPERRELLNKGLDEFERQLHQEAQAQIAAHKRDRRIELRSFVISAAAGVVSAFVALGVLLQGWFAGWLPFVARPH